MITRYRIVRVETDDRAWWPTREQINHILTEMERYGSNRGWVLGKALARARQGLEP